MRTEHQFRVTKAKQSRSSVPISCSKRRHRPFPSKPLPTNTITIISFKSRQQRLQHIRSIHPRATCSSTQRTAPPSCLPSSSSPLTTTTRRQSLRAAPRAVAMAISAAPSTQAQLANHLSFRQIQPFPRVQIWSGPLISPKSSQMSSLSTTQQARQT